MDNSVHKNHWKLGKVTKQIKGRDDAVRAVKIQVCHKVNHLELNVLHKEYLHWRLMHQ